MNPIRFRRPKGGASVPLPRGKGLTMQKHRQYLVAKSMEVFGRGVYRKVVQVAAMVGESSVAAYADMYRERGLTVVRRSWGAEVYQP